MTLWEGVIHPRGLQPSSTHSMPSPGRPKCAECPCGMCRRRASCNWASQKNLAGSLVFKGHTDNVGDLGMCTECLFNKNLFGLLPISPFVVPLSKGPGSAVVPQSSKALVISPGNLGNQSLCLYQAVLIEEPCQYNAWLG